MSTPGLTPPNFVTIDPTAIANAIVAYYESQPGGHIVQPADIEQLIFNSMAYRESLILNQVQSAAVQMLIDFSNAPILDYIVALVDVTRLPASAAQCTLALTLVGGHGALVIPAGLRIQTTDGQQVFTLNQAVTVQPTDTVVTVNVTCQTTGATGNNYAVGTISVILDPQAYLASAANTTISNGGADVETDDALRARAKIAPNSFSVAGPRDAYKFFARTASADIIDVAVTSPVPGTVNVYPLIAGGVATPQAILDAVFAVLNVDDIRPLTDTVNVISPTPVPYNVELDIILNATADQPTAVANIQALVNAYTAGLQSKIALDVIINKIIAIAMTGDVYDLTMPNPAADITMAENEFAQIGTVTINVVGIH